MLFAPLLMVLACTGEPTAPQAGSAPVAATWISELAAEPSGFGTLMEAEPREAWVALHANQLHAAYTGFASTTSPGKHRTAALLGRLNASLNRTQRLTNDKISKLRTERSIEPSAGLNQYTAMSACTADAFKVEVDGWSERVALISGTDAEALTAALVTPVIVEQAEGFERTFYDPCAYGGLARIWSGRGPSVGQIKLPLPEVGESAPLNQMLFSPYLTRADSVTDPIDTAPGAELLSLRPITGKATRQTAREQARALAEGVRTLGEASSASGSPEGIALLDELRILERFQHDWLTLRAEQWILAGQIEPAHAMLEQTIDVAQPGVGPHNSPLTLALLAETHLATGHTREALDALQRLSEAHPEVKGLQERVGDLAVLEGLGRHGDSKED